MRVPTSGLVAVDGLHLQVRPQPEEPDQEAQISKIILKEKILFIPPLFIHITLISMFASQMALLGFFYVIPLFFCLARDNRHCERECTQWGEKERKRKKKKEPTEKKHWTRFEPMNFVLAERSNHLTTAPCPKEIRLVIQILERGEIIKQCSY